MGPAANESHISLSSSPEFLTPFIGFIFFPHVCLKVKPKWFYWDFLSPFLQAVSPSGYQSPRDPHQEATSGQDTRSSGAACPSPVSPPGSQKGNRDNGRFASPGSRDPETKSWQQALPAGKRARGDPLLPGPSPARALSPAGLPEFPSEFKHREPCRGCAPWRTAVMLSLSIHMHACSPSS